MTNDEWIKEGERRGDYSSHMNTAAAALWRAYAHADLRNRRTLMKDLARSAIDYAERVQGWDSSADQMRVDLIDDSEV